MSIYKGDTVVPAVDGSKFLLYSSLRGAGAEFSSAYVTFSFLSWVWLKAIGPFEYVYRGCVNKNVVRLPTTREKFDILREIDSW